LKKFICVRGWQRNPTGAILEEWEYNRLPDEVKNRNFKEHLPEPVVVPEPIPVAPTVVAPPVVVEPKSTHTRFKPFSVDDTKEE